MVLLFSAIDNDAAHASISGNENTGNVFVFVRALRSFLHVQVCNNRESSELTICHLHISYNTPSSPSPQFLRNLFFQFLLGVTVSQRIIEESASGGGKESKQSALWEMCKWRMEFLLTCASTCAACKVIYHCILWEFLLMM